MRVTTRQKQASLQQYFNTTVTGAMGNAYMNSFERESMTFREGVDLMVNRAALAMKLSPDALKVVKACNAVLQLKFPVKLKGRTEVISGWWAIHSAHRLPAKGGMRYSPIVSQDEEAVPGNKRLSHSRLCTRTWQDCAEL